MVYDSFKAFMEKLVIPQKKANPNHIRLDGKTSGSTREAAGMFRHHNKVWKVDADTRYEPLLLAYDLMKKGAVNDPFVEEATATGKGTCLVLREKVKKLLPYSRFKYHYIYEIPAQ